MAAKCGSRPSKSSSVKAHQAKGEAAAAVGEMK